MKTKVDVKGKNRKVIVLILIAIIVYASFAIMEGQRAKFDESSNLEVNESSNSEANDSSNLEVYEINNNTSLSNEEKIIKILFIYEKIDWIKLQEKYPNEDVFILSRLSSRTDYKDVSILKFLESHSYFDGSGAESYSVLIGQLFVENQINFAKAYAMLTKNQAKYIDEYLGHYISYLDKEDLLIDSLVLLESDELNKEEKEAWIKLIDDLNIYKE